MNHETSHRDETRAAGEIEKSGLELPKSTERDDDDVLLSVSSTSSSRLKTKVREVRLRLQQTERQIKAKRRQIERTSSIWEKKGRGKIILRISEDKDFQETQKIAYPITFMKGEAKSCIEHCETSPNGYTDDMVLLEKQYGHPANVVKASIKRVTEDTIDQDSLARELDTEGLNAKSGKTLETKKSKKRLRECLAITKRIIIAGDMNVPDIEWSNASVKDNPQYGVAVNKTMIDLVDDHSLSQLVTFPTRQESVLDLVLTSHPDLVHSLSSVQGISDHSAVSFDLNLSVKVNKKKPRIVYKFAKANFTDIRKDATILSNDFFERHPENINVESNWQFFKSGLMNILSRSVPTKKSGSWNNSPWMTRDLKTSLRKKKRLYNNYKKSGKACDKEKYRKFQKLFKIKMKKAQDEYIADTLNSDLKEKPKKFWSMTLSNIVA
ncbi:predicted protein [Nematostella vectensis]|uniref:Endonuclease/exonuclease/phosphatase domain-containing protein n=1 Tax=Nematostella vectensis TaxID=45351 RepID=A7SX46_NEMVE|nr:predicted protein [Nematostella vectensis]|eukprot:XP_001623826.1 predicted protein [Nematostella vectensis]